MLELASNFAASYETVRTFLTSKEEPEIGDAVKWFDKVFDYNVPHGKKTRGLILVSAYKHFAEKHKLTEKSVELSCIVGWCLEVLQAFFLVADDIMDHSLTRRGRKCWYLMENVGSMAINDSVLLLMSVFEILRHYLRDHACYVNILEMFMANSYKTGLGQCIDCLTTPDGAKTDFSLLTQTRYATIVKYKTAYYSFDLPVRVALFLAEITDEEIHKEAQQILLRMGYLFQVQDDFLDCFGDPQITGKIGTDIEDGKCSWIAVEAVKLMSIEEINKFHKHYGIRDEESVKVIKSLYDKLNMKRVFFEFEEKEYKEINKQIAEFGKKSNVELKPFYGLLDIIYKREK